MNIAPMKKETIKQIHHEPFLSTLPNVLTMSRIMLIPVVTTAFYIDTTLSKWIAVIAFICACLTDFLDGYIARLMKQTSKFGQFLDPIADKLLIASTLLLLAGFDRISRLSFLPAIIILCREILVSGLREYLSALHVTVPVSYLAKWKTLIQMTSIALLLVGEIHGLSMTIPGELLLWMAALLTLITGYDYFRTSLKYF
jgi:cardiolipin synthase (CMP-forming)